MNMHGDLSAGSQDKYLCQNATLVPACIVYMYVTLHDFDRFEEDAVSWVILILLFSTGMQIPG